MWKNPHDHRPTHLDTTPPYPMAAGEKIRTFATNGQAKLIQEIMEEEVMGYGMDEPVDFEDAGCLCNGVGCEKCAPEWWLRKYRKPKKEKQEREAAQ